MVTQPEFRWFQCIIQEPGEKIHDLSTGSYLNNGEPDFRIPNASVDNNTNGFLFFGRCYSSSVWLSDIKMIFMLARKGLLELEQAAIKADPLLQSTNYSNIRKYNCELWLACRYLTLKSNDQNNLLSPCLADLFKHILIGLKRLQHLPDYILFNSTIINTSNHASFNYIHLSLDLFWLSLTLEHLLESNPTIKLDIFEKNLNALLSDLIYVGVRKFERINVYSDLSQQTPFLCSCFKEIWLLIQLYVEKLYSVQFCKDFWYYFNACVKEVLSSNKKDALTCLWLLYHVTCVQGFDKNGLFIGPQHYRIVSNYQLADQCLKIILNNDLDEQSMCSCLQLLSEFQIKWWKHDASFDLLQLLWEYFYKRLNIPCTSNSNPLIASAEKPCDFLALTDAILNNDLTFTSADATSYEIFLCLLAKHLTKHPTHWPKFKGRIYSKLAAPKLAAFTDHGLQNLIQLFFVLAQTINFNELTDKLQAILNQLPVHRSEHSVVIWCGYISLFQMRTQRGLSVSGDVSAPMSVVVHGASNDRARAHLMRIYIEGLKKLVDGNTELVCHEQLLFGGWISRYLEWSSHSDACFLLDILKTLVAKLRMIGGHDEWWVMFENHVVPSLLQLSGTVDAPNHVVELAAALISADANRYKCLLEHMSGDSIHISLSTKFLKSILELNRTNLDEFNDHQSLFIQAWIRIAVLNTDKTELSELTQIMSTLPQWSDIIGAIDVFSSDDPLYGLIRLKGAKVRDAQTMIENAVLKKWFETYFGRMDRWVAPVIAAAERGENSQLILRMFTCAALLFLHSAPALYIKNKNTCLLYRLIATLLLPSAVLTNKRPPNVVIGALRRTWHIFVRGIIRLDYKTDTYIERTLRDIVIRYVPHMYDATSPIIRCLDNEFDDNATIFILDKITTTFLVSKSKIIHEFTTQGLKLTLEMYRIQSDNICKINLLWRVTLPSAFELLMFIEDAANKQIIAQIIECVKSSQFYPDSRVLLNSTFRSLIDKHMAFYSTSVFRWLEMLIGMLPMEIEELVPHLKEAVQKLECMRGVGFDKTLRKGLQKIQEITNQQSK